MNSGVNLGCTVTTISCKNSGAVITLKLDDAPIGIMVKTTIAAVDDLNLKKNDCAYADIFWWDPKEPPVSGGRMVTVFIQGTWVTIPLGDAAQLPEPGSEDCTKMKGTSPLTDAVAQKYGYANITEFLTVVHTSLNDFGGCPPGCFVKQIESVLEYEYGWKWYTFRYGDTCKARICQMKEDSGSTPSAAQNDAWLHGFLSHGDYATEKSNALVTAKGSLDGPVLAGFCYTGTKARPDPNMLFRGAPSYDQKDKDLFSVPVNLYRKTETTTETIGRITIENVRKG
jgi:hypothetical protein